MIRKIKWNNHPVLGNLELDFTKTDGTCYNTVFLIGKNGCGKSTILDTISIFLAGGSFIPFSYIEYEIGGITYIGEPLSNSVTNNGYICKKNPDDSYQKELYGVNSKNIEDIRNLGVACSKARSGLIIENIDSSKSHTTDSSLATMDTSNNVTSICQLIVDIYQSDTNRYAENHRKAPPTNGFDDFLRSTESKFGRFSRAFDSFSTHLNFTNVADKQNSKKINFTTFEHLVEIADLSTGEQQIILRGARLLQNLKKVENGHVFIDEPELSMHPSWEHKIAKYYRELFTINNIQKAQILFSTHSRYVIQAAIEDKQNCAIIVLKRDDKNNIIAEKINDRFGNVPITDGEIMYKAFEYYTNDYLLFLYGQLAEKIMGNLNKDSVSVEEVDSHIKNSPEYDASKHNKEDSFKSHHYHTLPTYIRNAIDHPESGRVFGITELKESVELLIKLI